MIGQVLCRNIMVEDVVRAKMLTQCPGGCIVHSEERDQRGRGWDQTYSSRSHLHKPLDTDMSACLIKAWPWGPCLHPCPIYSSILPLICFLDGCHEINNFSTACTFTIMSLPSNQPIMNWNCEQINILWMLYIKSHWQEPLTNTIPENEYFIIKWYYLHF